MSSHSVEIKEIKPIEKGNYRAILGFAGAGFIGNTAAMFVTRSKGYQQVAWIKSNYIPPMTLITNGAPIQSFRIHLDEAEKILFIITESLIPAEGCWPIAEALLRWLKAKGVQEIYSLDGLPFGAVSPEIKALTYSVKVDLSKHGYPALREGALSGINSCVLEECVEKKYPYACIFIPTNKLTSIDYAGAADAIDVLNKIFKLGVDSSPLRGSNEVHGKASDQKQSPFGKMFKKG
ncbi:MAG: PAC2 family protein [Candidatus Bathyarchaeota archaeon]|nr:PAC2 family protein [Candidatus Bathyarchaeota archaeon]